MALKSIYSTLCKFHLNFIKWKKLEDNVDYIQSRITIASYLLNYRLINYRQKLLLNNWAARLIAFRLFVHNNFKSNFTISNSFSLGIINKLYYLGFVYPSVYFYLKRKKGFSSLFHFPRVYESCLSNLVNMLVLPVNETRTNMSFPYFRPYRNCYDAFFTINKIFIGNKNLAFYFESNGPNILTNSTKIWLIKNLPLNSALTQRIFAQKPSFSIFAVKDPVLIFSRRENSFELTILAYLLNDLNSYLVENRQTNKFALFTCLNKLFIFSHTPNEFLFLKDKIKTFFLSRGIQFNNDYKINTITKGLNLLYWNVCYRYLGRIIISINKNYLKKYKCKLKSIIKSSINNKLSDLVKDINSEITNWSRSSLFFHEFKFTCSDLDLYVNKMFWRFLKRYYPKRTNNWIFIKFWKKFSGVWKFFILDEANQNKLIFLKSHYHIIKKIRFFSKGLNVFNCFNKIKLYETLFDYNLGEFAANYRTLFLKQKGLCRVCKRPVLISNFTILTKYSKLTKTNLLSDLILVHSYCREFKI